MTTEETRPEPSGTIDDGFGSPIADRVHDLLAPVLATVGAELVDVQWAGGTLRIVADRPDGGGGITVDGLAEINRLVSPILDQHDPVPGRYTLEVSSPGVECPLRRPDHFRRAVGETVSSMVYTAAGSARTVERSQATATRPAGPAPAAVPIWEMETVAPGRSG